MVKTRTHFAHRIDRLDDAGELIEHLAGIESFELAEVAYRAAVKLCAFHSTDWVQVWVQA